MKSLWDFLAQNHKGMINGRRWWAVFVEGAGNEEQPWDKHPEISKCTVLRRNDLSVFHLSPCPRLNISFESCHQKALKTVDPSEQSKETSPVINYKIISQGYQANFPLQNSSSSTQTSSHPPIFPIFAWYSEELGGGGKNKAGLLLHLAELWKMRQKPQGQRQEGLCSGHSAGQSHLLQKSQHHSRAINPWAFAEPSRGRNSAWEKDDHPEQPPALPGCCLLFPAD